MEEQMMSDTKRDYTIGYGKPPKGRPFQKGQSGNPRGPGGKKGLAAMLAVALDERVTITINGRRRRMTKREAIVAQMVDKSTSADLRAIKMLIDMQKEAEAKATAEAARRGGSARRRWAASWPWRGRTRTSPAPRGPCSCRRWGTRTSPNWNLSYAS